MKRGCFFATSFEVANVEEVTSKYESKGVEEAITANPLLPPSFEFVISKIEDNSSISEIDSSISVSTRNWLNIEESLTLKVKETIPITKSEKIICSLIDFINQCKCRKCF